MSEPLREDQQPSTSCPHCDAHTARPVEVTTSNKDEPDIVRIKMKCQDCGATWMVKKMTHDDPPA